MISSIYAMLVLRVTAHCYMPETTRVPFRAIQRLFAYSFAMVAAVALAAEPTVPNFENDVRPLLKQRCVKCHGSLKQEGKLNLGSPAGIARGGEHGAAIVPGDLAKSRLWQLIERN